MAEFTYYFNARGDAVWSDPDNIVDNNLETFGYTNAKKTAQQLTGNSCPGDDLGAILKVELRLFGKGDGNDRIDITPVFPGGNGDAHPTTPVVSPGDWTAYVDITNDTNHPDWSLWSHIQTLDCIIDSVSVGKGNTLYCAKVEIRVTTWILPDIDVGSPAIDRASVTSVGYTYISKENPANASGILHTVMVWAASNITGLRVGTFYPPEPDLYPNYLKCRDSEVVGDVEAGAERAFSGLSIDVQEGDYIGCYVPATGEVERDTAGYEGIWYKNGEYIDPGDLETFSFAAGDAISLLGYGAIEAPPPPEYIPRHSGTVGVLMI
ncbi:hypothetical protein ES703_43848 [subsurface metagenome]